MIDMRLELGRRAEVLDSFNVFEIFIASELGHLLLLSFKQWEY